MSIDYIADVKVEGKAISPSPVCNGANVKMSRRYKVAANNPAHAATLAKANLDAECEHWLDINEADICVTQANAVFYKHFKV